MTRQRSPVLPLLFAAGYLLTWAAAGLLAFVIALIAAHSLGDVFAWNRAGRSLAGATIVVAAIYELTPLKDVCLGKCRSPLDILLGPWRDGWSGALRMGAKNGAWCVGCCWALMASLFALGVMTVVWMTYTTVVVLLTLGVLLLTAPEAIPALAISTSNPMTEMTPLGH